MLFCRSLNFEVQVASIRYAGDIFQQRFTSIYVQTRILELGPVTIQLDTSSKYSEGHVFETSKR